jgi:hypothetical protein
MRRRRLLDLFCGAGTVQRLEDYYRGHRIFCGPGLSVSVDQDALGQERFLIIALMQLLHEAGVHPTSRDLLTAYDRAEPLMKGTGT